MANPEAGLILPQSGCKTKHKAILQPAKIRMDDTFLVIVSPFSVGNKGYCRCAIVPGLVNRGNVHVAEEAACQETVNSGVSYLSQLLGGREGFLKVIKQTILRGWSQQSI